MQWCTKTQDWLELKKLSVEVSSIVFVQLAYLIMFFHVSAVSLLRMGKSLPQEEIEQLKQEMYVFNS